MQLAKFIQKHLFGFPHEADNVMNYAKNPDPVKIAKVFQFGSGVLLNGKIAQASTDAPVISDEIKATEYDPNIVVTTTYEGTGSYEIRIAGVTNPVAARVKVYLSPGSARFFRCTGVTLASGVLKIALATSDGSDVASGFVKVEYV